MNGLIILNKPGGVSSAQALGWVRRLTRQRKSGHAGTLDPLAEGVLLLCLGSATRLVERLMELPKVYETRVLLGATNETYDMERPPIRFVIPAPPTLEEIESVLAGFIGEIDQVPPRTSAVKIGGQPAYRRVRAGESFKMPTKRVRIDSIRVLNYEWPYLRFVMHCGRGTYVRSLVRDLGLRLGCGGVIDRLRRLAVGPFDLQRSVSPQAIEDNKVNTDYIIPIERVLTELENNDSTRETG